MGIAVIAILIIAILASITLLSQQQDIRQRASTIPSTSHWIDAYYYPSVRERYPISLIDFSSFTILVVAIVIPKSDGTLDYSQLGVTSENQAHALLQEITQTAHTKGKKVLLSVGGGGTTWPSCANNSEVCKSIIKNLAQTIKNDGFDGLDLDFEDYRQGNEVFLQLVKDARSELPDGAILAIPVTGYPNDTTAQIAQLADQMNIGTYWMIPPTFWESDGKWNQWKSWFTSPLFGEAPGTNVSINKSVDLFINSGVPTNKIGIGIGPSVNICYTGHITNPRQQPVDTSDQIKAISYKDIMENYYSEANYHYDEEAQAPYLSFSSPKGSLGCTYITYDDIKSVTSKGDYVKNRSLGGVIIFELSGTRVSNSSNPDALIKAISSAFPHSQDSQSQIPTVTPVTIGNAPAETLNNFDLNDDGKIDRLDLNIMYAGFSHREGD